MNALRATLARIVTLGGLLTGSPHPTNVDPLFERFNAARIYFWLAGVSLLFLVFLVPPFQVPDEPQHFFRSYQLSKLEVWSRVQDGTMGSDFPASMPELVHHFLGTSEVHTKTRRVVPRQPLVDTLEELRRPLEVSRTRFIDTSGIQSYAPLPYIPQALAIAAGRALDVGPLGLLYMGRLANALVALLITSFAISLFPVGRTFALVVALLPMTQFMTASLSPDALTIASAFLFTAVIARFLADGQWPVQRRLIGFASGLAMSIVKVVYLPLLFAGLGAMLGKGKVSNAAVRKIIFMQLAAAVVTIALIWLWFWSLPVNSTSGPPPREGINLHGQVAYLSEDAFRALRIVVRSVYVKAEFLGKSTIGMLGWLNVPLATWVYVLLGLALPLSACAEPRSAPFGLAVAAWLLFVATAVVPLIELALYVGWTPVGAYFVEGVQGRYFIPALPMLGVAVAALVANRKPPTFSGQAYLGVVGILFATTAALHATIILRYGLF